MGDDWRSLENKNKTRQAQVSGNDAMRGIFSALIDSASGEKQTAKLVYSGGERSIPLPMPFESSESWIRSIPTEASNAIISYRSDTQDPVFLSYENSNPQKQLDNYAAGYNVYRPLNPGEHEIHSSGYAQSYYSSRPALESRGGLIRSWLDQDKLEAGAKAPLHTRQIWQHQAASIGDEERFGAVRRPLNFLLKNPASAVLALSLTSSIFHDYPYPDATLPGGVPAVFNLASQAVATATQSIAELAGKFKQRLFAKEYLKVIKNPLFGILPVVLNPKLIDFREGQVFDDDGFQTIGGQGAYLRAQYKYYTSAFDPTTIEIDEIGNIDWRLSLVAKNGWSVTVPTGGISFLVPLRDISMKALAGGIDTITGQATSMLAGTDISLTSMGGDITLDAFTGNISETAVLGNYSVTTTVGKMDFSATQNITMKTKLSFLADALVKAQISSPFVDIGKSATSSMAMGTELAAWLTELVAAFLKASSLWTIGNLGAPCVINPGLAADLGTLQAKIITLTSKTCKVQA